MHERWRTRISAAETSLPAPPAADAAHALQPAQPVITASAFSTWPQRLIWLVLGVLLVESFLFHRKAVY